MKKLITYVIILVFLFMDIDANNTAKADTTNWPTLPDNISVPSIIVMETSTNTVLLEKNINKKYYPASITKILTSLIAIEKSPKDLSNSVNISAESIKMNTDGGGQYLPGIEANDTLSMKSALYAVMLRSANEIADSVGKSIAGSNENFAKMMTQKAKSLGCSHSNFTNSYGLHDDNHYTTAYDMALISSSAIKLDTFQKIVKEPSYDIPELGTTVTSHHLLVNNPSASWCIGGKTGYTNIANHTLVTFSKQNGMTLVCVVMNASSSELAANDTKTAIDYCYKNFSLYNILETEGSNIKNDLKSSENYFTLSNNSQASIYIDDNSSIVLPKNANYKDVSKDVTFFKDITLSKGINNVGKISYAYGNKQLTTCDIMLNYTSSMILPKEMGTYQFLLTSKNSNSQHSFGSSVLDYIYSMFIIAIVLLLIVFLSRFFYFKHQRSYSYRRRRTKKFY